MHFLPTMRWPLFSLETNTKNTYQLCNQWVLSDSGNKKLFKIASHDRCFIRDVDFLNNHEKQEDKIL